MDARADAAEPEPSPATAIIGAMERATLKSGWLKRKAGAKNQFSKL